MALLLSTKNLEKHNSCMERCMKQCMIKQEQEPLPPPPPPPQVGRVPNKRLANRPPRSSSSDSTHIYTNWNTGEQEPVRRKHNFNDFFSGKILTKPVDITQPTTMTGPRRGRRRRRRRRRARPKQQNPPSSSSDNDGDFPASKFGAWRHPENFGLAIRGS